MSPELVKMLRTILNERQALMKIPYSTAGNYGIWIVLMSLGGCARYQVTLNEQPLYSPPPLYSQFEVADEALKNCLHQTIADKHITHANQLTQLVCRHAGIKSIQGLEGFDALEELDLSHNTLRDVKPLQSFSKLRLLKINDNPDLLCDTLPQARLGLQIINATHCTG
jgi:Leucine-rich repeat (LRR) protein